MESLRSAIAATDLVLSQGLGLTLQDDYALLTGPGWTPRLGYLP